MTVRVTIGNVKQIGDGVWIARIAPRQAAIFGSSQGRFGDWTVLGLSCQPIFRSEEGSLELDPESARLLNTGATDQLVLIGPAASQGRADEPKNHETRPVQTGDEQFVTALPATLRELGSKLLAGVRVHFRGDLRYYPDSRRYVETPDNFWTVTIRSRVNSLDITVRGTGAVLGSPKSLEIKPDRGSYTRFKLSSAAQLEEAVEVIRKAGIHRR